MDNIVIINRPADVYRRQPIPPSTGDVWTTCLRQMAFCDAHLNLPFELTEHDQVLHNDDALSFLIEVLCGLHSPVFGETEVFGQFKNFIEQAKLAHSPLITDHSKWLRFVFETVKSIRHDHLTHTGSQSYGSTLRRLTKTADSIDIIGAGQLTTEILPWIIKDKTIRVHVRNRDKYINWAQKFKNIDLVDINTTFNLFSTHMIIAAPIENEKLIKSLLNGKTNCKTVFDLRATGFKELNQLMTEFKINPEIEMISLQNFFEVFNDDQSKFSRLKDELKNLIRTKSSDFILRSEIRPLGWDDLCL